MPLVPVGVAAPAPGAAATAPRRPVRFAAILEARAASTPAPPAVVAPARAHPALAALSGIERAQSRLEGVLAAARAGRTFTAAELIGLQAEAYRCAQTVDLASKLVEQGAQALKQTLNTQL
ncbi:MAG TPA: hypothetical protein VF894_05895 [Anaeromyxobacter sp.]